MRFLSILLACSIFILPTAARAECWTNNVSQGAIWGSADEACDALVYDTYHHMNGYIELSGTPGVYWCYENDANGIYLGPIYTLPPANYCSTATAGPYRNVAIGGTVAPGNEYTSGQRDKIKTHAAHKCQGSVRSDLATSAGNKVLKGWLGPDVQETCTTLYTDPIHVSNPCYAVVHHVVPKNDVQSCSCGANSSENALVISRRLNGLLNNLPPSAGMLSYVRNLQPNQCPQ